MSGIYAQAGKEKTGVAILSYSKSHHIRKSLEELLVQLDLERLGQRKGLKRGTPKNSFYKNLPKDFEIIHSCSNFE